MVSLERAIAADLGHRVVLAFARAPLERDELTAGESEGLARIKTEQRSTEWLRGRAALRTVMIRRGEGLDTSEVRLPHARYSLAHSDSLAVAAAGDAGGMGVDFEHFKPMRGQAARYFLTGPEHSWIDSLPDVERSAELLRLWTVKEALFKADVRNAQRTLRDYRVQEPRTITGCAWTPDSVPQRYTTRRIDGFPGGGLLSVAITRE